MKKRLKTAMPLIAAVLSVLLLLGATLAYFTDRADATISGSVGGIAINTNASSGKSVFAYDEMSDASISVTNSGNKSVDIKVIVTMESDMPIVTGFDAGSQTYLPCYRMFNSDSASYTYSYDGTDFTESATPDFISGTDATSDAHPETKILKYEFNGILNGNHPTKDNEIETGGLSALNIPLKIYFPQYTSLPNWDALVKNAYYRLTYKVYGKQHRNTDETDWVLLNIS